MSPADMNDPLETVELAKLYESQGYSDEARKIYTSLGDETAAAQITPGMNPDLDQENEQPDKNHTASDPAREKIAGLLEKWLTLMVVGQRLERFKKIKSRLL